MPKPGIKQINVAEEYHQKAKQDAEKLGKTLKEHVEELIDHVEVPVHG